jgi:hypothetical protein
MKGSGFVAVLDTVVTTPADQLETKPLSDHALMPYSYMCPG